MALAVLCVGDASLLRRLVGTFCAVGLDIAAERGCGMDDAGLRLATWRRLRQLPASCYLVPGDFVAVTGDDIALFLGMLADQAVLALRHAVVCSAPPLANSAAADLRHGMLVTSWWRRANRATW